MGLLASLIPSIGGKAALYLGLAAAALVVFLLVRHELDARAAAEAAKAVEAEQLDRMQQIHQDDAAALAEQQRLHTQDLTAVAAAHAAEASAAARVAALQKENANAPSADDGPIAPLARRGLDRLHQLLAAPAPHRDAAHRAPADPAGAAAAGPAAGAAGGR